MLKAFEHIESSASWKAASGWWANASLWRISSAAPSPAGRAARVHPSTASRISPSCVSNGRSVRRCERRCGRRDSPRPWRSANRQTKPPDVRGTSGAPRQSIRVSRRTWPERIPGTSCFIPSPRQPLRHEVIRTLFAVWHALGIFHWRVEAVSAERVPSARDIALAATLVAHPVCGCLVMVFGPGRERCQSCASPSPIPSTCSPAKAVRRCLVVPSILPVS